MAKNRLELWEREFQGGTVYWVRGTVNRRRIRKSLGTGDKAEAERLRTEEELKALNQKTVFEKGERTFAQAAEEYLKNGGRDGNGGDPRFLGPIIKHFGPDKTLGSITAGELKSMANTLYPNATGSTKNRQAIGPALAVINHAAELGWCHPVSVSKFAERKVKKEAVDRAWLDKFRTHCEHAGISAMALVMFTSGARRSDAMRMYRVNFRYDARTIKVGTSKNGDEHVFPLTREAAAALKALEYDDALNIFGIRYVEEIYPVWRATCEAAGIPYVPPHQSGRHSFATEMITKKGVDAATAASIANWKSVGMLMERYVHSKEQLNAMEQMEPQSAKTRRGKK